MSRARAIGIVITIILIAASSIGMYIWMNKPPISDNNPEIEVILGTSQIEDGSSGIDLGISSLDIPKDVVFIVNNIGKGPLTLTKEPTHVTVTGIGFSLKFDASSPISVGDSTLFTISFNSSTSGDFIGEISINNNDNDENPFDFTVNISCKAPEIQVEYDGGIVTDGSNLYSLGTAEISILNDYEFVINNIGAGILLLTHTPNHVILNGNGFSLSEDADAIVQSKNSTSFTIQFQSITRGVFTGSVSIENTDFDENPYNFTFQVICKSPEIQVEYLGECVADGTNPYYLGDAFISTPIDYIFTINNTGTQTLGLINIPSRVIVTGAEFTLEEDAEETIPIDSSTTFTIRFYSDIAGIYIGAISIANNDSDEDPYDFTINVSCIEGIYQHTISIDGDNDFNINSERFCTSSENYYGYISWDSNFVYIGMSGGDIGSASSHKWLLLYIGGSIGTPSGLLYNTQQPTLPFNAKYHIQWRTDWSSPNMKIYEGGSWSDMVFSGSLVLNGNFVEMRIPLADIGSPSTILNIHLSCIYDLSSNEVTYAGVPFNSFIDGFDPNYTHYYSFNLAGSISPSSYSPI